MGYKLWLLLSQGDIPKSSSVLPSREAFHWNLQGRELLAAEADISLCQTDRGNNHSPQDRISKADFGLENCIFHAPFGAYVLQQQNSPAQFRTSRGFQIPCAHGRSSPALLPSAKRHLPPSNPVFPLMRNVSATGITVHHSFRTLLHNTFAQKLKIQLLIRFNTSI